MARRKAEPAEVEALAPFADLVGKIPDERIAEMAGVPVEAVSAPELAEPTVDLEPAPDPDEFAVEPEHLDETVLMTRDAIVPELDSDPDTEDGPPPHSIRVLRKARVLDERGRLWVLRTRDIYNGPKAHFLWVHHRDLVEPFPS